MVSSDKVVVLVKIIHLLHKVELRHDKLRETTAPSSWLLCNSSIKWLHDQTATRKKEKEKRKP